MTGNHVLRIVTSFIAPWVALTIGASPAAAQNRGVEIGGHVSILRLSELEITDTGVGADVLWRLTPVVAIDGALAWFPGADDVTGVLESQPRALGLAGLRMARAHRRVELFARARAGFLRFGKHDRVVCIAIFPTPLSCQLATGYAAFAADLGGGVSAGLTGSGRLRLRIEAGDLLVRYGLQALRPRGEATDGFVGHNLLVTAGLGWRF